MARRMTISEHTMRDPALLRGSLLLLLAMTLVPIMDAAAKQLGQRLPVIEVTWGRYFFNALLVLPVALWRHGAHAFIVPRLNVQLARGACLVVATFVFFLTLTQLPMADTLALGFLYPLLVALLAPFMLGERVSRRSVVAAGIGFLGALLIIRPGSELFQPAAVIGLSVGFFFAGYVILTRLLAGTAPPLITLAYGTLVGAVLCSALVPFSFVAPTPAEWAIMLLIGVVSSVSHLLLIMAYASAPASVLAPLGYFEMIATVTIGWLWFGDIPILPTWAGIAVICGTGLYVTLAKDKGSGP